MSQAVDVFMVSISAIDLSPVRDWQQAQGVSLKNDIIITQPQIMIKNLFINKKFILIRIYDYGFVKYYQQNINNNKHQLKEIMENKVTLGYWAIRGLAERIRMLMEYLQISYDQVKYNQDNRDKWFQQIKPELQKKNSAITLPYLLDGNNVISQSQAIIIYLIHKSGKKQLLGRTAEQQVNMATINGVLKDVHGLYIKLVYGAYGDGPFEIAKVEYVHKFRPYLNKIVGRIEGKQFSSGQLTWVDFALADFIQTLSLLAPQLIDQYKSLFEYQNKVWNVPGIKKYHESERYHERPCNNYSAFWK